MNKIDIAHDQVPTRENRLGAITGYVGTIGELNTLAIGCGVQNKERGFSQASACSSGCCQGQLCSIQNVVVVDHASIGCAGSAIANNVNFKGGARLRGLEYSNVRIISTNLLERDTVFGATAKLRDTIIQAYQRYKPDAVFVTTSCVSGIIGEDIAGVLEGLRRVLPIPLVPAFCEGFKSKVWASGFDSAFHAVLHGLVEPPRQPQKNNKVNFVNFRGSARKEIIRTFGKLGVEPTFLLQFATVEELKHVSEARATVSICGTLGSYFGNALEQQYDVPYIKTEQPHGIKGYSNWLRSLGQFLGKEAEVEVHLAEEEQRTRQELTDLRNKLRGKTAVVGMGPSFGHNFTRVLEELEVNVVWAATWHFDQNYDHGDIPESTKRLAAENPNLRTSVGDQQNYEVVNLLTKLNPDLYVTRHGGSSVWSTKMGIATHMLTDEFTAFGYGGLVNFGNILVDKLTNRALAKRLAQRIKLPYTKWWLQQDSFSFIQDEAC
jgi:nitrogenase molybdenum-iron protein alpha chain